MPNIKYRLHGTLQNLAGANLNVCPECDSDPVGQANPARPPQLGGGSGKKDYHNKT